MFNNVLILACIAGMTFGGWPLIVRTTKIYGFWIPLFIILGSTITVVIIASVVKVKTGLPALNVNGALICLLAGMFNGLGFLAYAKLAATKSIDLSIAIPLAAVLVAVVAAIGGTIFYGEQITITKVFGLLAAGVAIVLLNR